MDKREGLAALEKEMRENVSLPLQTNLVFGEGNPDCEAFFVGEAPGLNEDVQKRPFVGRGGKLLRECIRGIGWREADVYITNIVKRRPPENRDPMPDELAAYAPYLARQIEIINPPVIVPLGRFSMNYFLPAAKITRDQGKAFRAGGRIIVPQFHPAAALRSAGVMEQFRASFALLPQIIAGRLPIEDADSSPVAAEREKPAQKSLFS